MGRGKSVAPGRVVIIDDEPWIRESLNLLLSRRGFDVQSAASAGEAVDAILKNPPDLAILDYNLPDMNGLDTLTKIREINKDLPVIFMTGYGSETISVKAFKLGIEDYFIKPFDPKELIGRVVQITGEKEARQDERLAPNISPPELGREIGETSGIGRTVKFMQENFRSRLSLEEAAQLSGVSHSHFSRLFKRIMGISFSDYLSYLRVKKAEETLIRRDINISEVAFSVGFNSLRQFERAFKSVFGCSALQYRSRKTRESAPGRRKKAKKVIKSKI